MQPETNYARSGDAWVAYQVTGKGLIDIVLITGYMTPIDTHFEQPRVAHFIDRLGSFARVIRYDRRGIGLSDPVTAADPPTLEGWVTDGLAVRDALGSERSTLISFDPAGSMVALSTAATHPSRVASLVLVNPTACPMQREDFPFGVPAADIPEISELIEQRWVSGEPAVAAAKDTLSTSEVDWLVRAQRRGASPTTARTMFTAWFDTDIRSLLPAINTPTLVLHRPRASMPGRTNEGVRYVAESLANAKYVELEGDEPAVFFSDADGAIAEIQEFLTGARPAQVSEDRVFAALLFTDIVASTEQAASVGDARWRAVLDRHDAVVRSNLERFRGRWVNPTGDGVLATFDGPARAVACARAINESVRELGIDIRAGIHAGEVVARGEDVAGIAVNIAHRVASLADRGEILVSRTITDLVAGSGLEFVDRGSHVLKGVPDEWHIYAVAE